MRFVRLVLLAVALALTTGCATAVRVVGGACALRGVVQREDGTPLAGVPVAVSGINPVSFPFTMIPGPISPSWREIAAVRSDADGRFACTVPYYFSYKILAGDSRPIAGVKDNAANLRSKDIVLRAKEPNQSPVTTLAAVIGRANEPAISRHPQRELILKNLQLLVDDAGKEGANHFFACRVGCRDWIFWREGRSLMPTSFEVAVGDQEITADQIWTLRIRHCRKPIRLDSSVVPTRADLPPGTTFHVTRDFVAGVVYDCVLNGERVVVQKEPSQASEPTAPSGRGSS